MINKLTVKMSDQDRAMMGSNRHTGLSTAIALREISQAIQKPGQWIQVTDHFPYKAADQHTWNMCKDIVAKLELLYFEFKMHRDGTFWMRSTHIVP